MSVTNICATVWEVVIHAPSSKPALIAPRRSARPKLDKRPFSVEMKVPIKTATNPSHGIDVGGAGKVGAERPVLWGVAGVLTDGSAHRCSLQQTCPALFGLPGHPHHQ